MELFAATTLDCLNFTKLFYQYFTLVFHCKAFDSAIVDTVHPASDAAEESRKQKAETIRHTRSIHSTSTRTTTYPLVYFPSLAIPIICEPIICVVF